MEQNISVIYLCANPDGFYVKAVLQMADHTSYNIQALTTELPKRV